MMILSNLTTRILALAFGIFSLATTSLSLSKNALVEAGPADSRNPIASVFKREAFDDFYLPPLHNPTIADIRHTVRKLEELYFDRKKYGDNHILANAVEIAYEAIGKDPTPRGTNYAHAFIQYRDFVHPDTSLPGSELTNAQRLLLFMAGDQSSHKDKMEFATLIDNDLRALTWLNRAFYMLRFRSQELSLEGLIWLRNFERVFPPTHTESRTMAQRMNDIADGSYSTPKTVANNAMEVFYTMYDRAHRTGANFNHVADFASLDYDYDMVLGLLPATRDHYSIGDTLLGSHSKSTDIGVLASRAYFYDQTAQGDCVNDLTKLEGVHFVIESAFCAIQASDYHTEPSLLINAAIGRFIAQNFKSYAAKKEYEVLDHDNRTDEHKYLAFALSEWSPSVQSGELAGFVKYWEDLQKMRAL